MKNRIILLLVSSIISIQMYSQNLKVVKVDVSSNLLLISGAVPGHKNGYLVITKAKKKIAKKAAVKK